MISFANLYYKLSAQIRITAGRMMLQSSCQEMVWGVYPNLPRSQPKAE